MNLGFIGVGNIGAPIASRLLGAGHSLVIHDLRPEAAQALLRAVAAGDGLDALRATLDDLARQVRAAFVLYVEEIQA